MLTTALTQLEKVKTLITNAEDEEGLKEAVEQMHSAMEELGIRPTNERRMEPS
jgi:coenzyme F420-reducing hydrogenase delta subunit